MSKKLSGEQLNVTDSETQPSGIESEIGLESSEVQRRLVEYGYNEIPEKKTSFLFRLARRFWGIVPWMLEITAVVTFLLGKYPDTVIIVALLLFNAGISLLQERRAKSAMSALKQRLRVHSRVKRDGSWSLVPARELVPGDLIRVRVGDLVPADVKIIGGNLDVDQSALTGESVAVEKSHGELVYSGSAVKRGEATGTVNATGTRTYFGKTIELVELAKPKLHMEEVTVRVARLLAVIVVAALLTAFVYALLTGFQLAVLLPLAAVLLVAAVPVAMPTMFTLNMALGSSALAKEGVLVTRLSASEDAAAMDVLCADKTGTKTMNKLFVEEELPFNGFQKRDVLLYGALASNEANQDPIDSAFLVAARDSHVSTKAYSQLSFVPFDPQTRMTGAAVQSSGETFFVRKGSANAISVSCGMTEREIGNLNAEAERLSSEGLRVIAIAKGDDERSLKIVGLAGLADRLREDSRSTIEQIKNLGVSTKMLTGDSLPIAKNIAQQLGLGRKVTGLPDIKKGGTLDQKGSFGLVVEESGGIAEIYPEDKYTIVKALQSNGHVVGMTGDGVNDAPALKQAEVGIAVKNATDIAKDSASAVLTTEGLEGIVSMVKTGRTIYQRVFSWVLNMVTKKIHLLVYVVTMFFLIHSFVISVLSMVLLVFLTDFATMSISTDNVRYSLKPESLRVSKLFKIGLSLGILSAVEGILLTLAGMRYFGLSSDINKLYAFSFAYLVLTGLFNLMLVRERNRFWKSRPSNFLIVTTVTEILIVTAISSFGFLDLAPLSYVALASIFGYILVVSFLINDPIKVYLMGKFNSSSQ